MADLTSFKGKSLITTRKIGPAADSLQERLRKSHQAKAAEQANGGTKPNRILLLLDISGSMASPDYGGSDTTPKIEHLRNALQGFAESINSVDTSVAAATFPWKEGLILNPTSEQALIHLHAMRLDACGDTPMGQTMERGLSIFSITRGIIISDGDQTDGGRCFTAASQYAEARIPLDCVHIGSSEGGEETMKRIASTTGGLYIKFKDVGSFAKSLKYLSPQLRPLLADSSEAARLIGATEVR